MKIKKIKVTDLFDYYCYEIEMKKHNTISIIHAPNGYGKTTVFKMITYLLNLDVVEISAIPFSEFVVETNDGQILRAMKTIKDTNKKREYAEISLIFEILANTGKTYSLEIPILPEVLSYIKEEGIELYIHRMEMRRRRISKEERVENINILNKYEKYIKQLEVIRSTIEVNFIDSNRLFSSHSPINRDERVRRDKYRRENRVRITSDMVLEDFQDMDNRQESIIRDAKDIFHRIQEARQIYSLESEKKDRNFPDRLVKYINSSNEFFDDVEIAEVLKELEKKRLELENAGLVLPGNRTLAPTKSIDDTMRKFYTLYIKDTFEKLSLYDEIKAKLELFIEIFNTKTIFSNKRMRIDNEKGVVFEPIESKSGDKNTIPLEKLSSGEKHDFIMFYELIFNSDKTKVFLIDEPEISLHVAWQMEFINVLEKICELNGTQAIVATHSPDIVNGHDDLLISLGVE